MGKGKSTKRERKFQASGGVTKRIQKGTITKKGKLRKRKKDPQTNQKAASSSGKPAGGEATERRQDRSSSNDFLGPQNLAGLDIDSFFTEVADKIEKGELDDGSSAAAASTEGDDDEVEASSSEENGGEKESADQEDDDDDSNSDASPSSGDSVSENSDAEDDEDNVAEAEARMKREMANLQSADPTFHKFLKENEESLLEFGEDDAEEALDGENDADGGELAVRGDGKDRATKLTAKVLQSLLQGAFKSRGVRGLKKLVGAYKSACHMADSSPEEEAKTRPGESGKSYVIESSKVFDQLMMKCLDHCHKAFHYHLLDETTAKPDSIEADESEDKNEDESSDNKPLAPKLLEKSSKWDDMKPILMSFFRSTLHILSEAKEPELLAIILKALSKYIPYLSPFPRLASAALKSLLALWSAPLESSEDFQVVRLHAFLRIRQLALTQPFPFVEDCMKKTYLAYCRRAKFAAPSSVAALPTLTFMGNCIVELYSLDYHSAYQHAFVYIRQLALLLRSALQKKTPESLQEVYCWQYMYSLKLWVAVLSAGAPQEDGATLKSLLYPLTEVIFGTSRLSPSTRYLPLRLQCVRLLQQLAAASETFIPTAPLLLDCLDFKEFHVTPQKVRSSGGAGPSSSSRALPPLEQLLKLPSTDRQPCLRTLEQSEPAVAEVMSLLRREAELYRYSPGFPEYAAGMERRLRRFAKEVRQVRWKAYARGCLDVLERWSSEAVVGRAKLSEAPRDVSRLEALRPMSVPSMRERLQTLLEKERRTAAAAVLAVEASAAPPTKKRARSRKGEDDEGDSEDEGDRDNRAGRSKSFTKRAKPDSKQGKPSAATKVSAADLKIEDDVQEGVNWSSDEEQ